MYQNPGTRVLLRTCEITLAGVCGGEGQRDLTDIPEIIGFCQGFPSCPLILILSAVEVYMCICLTKLCLALQNRVPLFCHLLSPPPQVVMLLKDMLRLTQATEITPPLSPVFTRNQSKAQALKGLPSLHRLQASLLWALCVYFPFTGPHYTHSHSLSLTSSTYYTSGSAGGAPGLEKVLS